MNKKIKKIDSKEKNKENDIYIKFIEKFKESENINLSNVFETFTAEQLAHNANGFYLKYFNKGQNHKKLISENIRSDGKVLFAYPNKANKVIFFRK